MASVRATYLNKAHEQLSGGEKIVQSQRVRFFGVYEASVKARGQNKVRRECLVCDGVPDKMDRMSVKPDLGARPFVCQIFGGKRKRQHF